MYRDAAGGKHKAYVKNGSKNEIIISAGALGSPQLLMLSGVGPLEQLKAHNISVVLDQPMVGQGMSDNPMNAVYVPSPAPVEISLIEVVGITHFGAYIEAASGENFAGGSPTGVSMFSSEVHFSFSGESLLRLIRIYICTYINQLDQLTSTS